LGELTQNAARDPRVKLEVADVSKLVAHVAKNPRMHRFDAIVLDMYQGPQNQIGPNDPLYGVYAVRRARDALTPTGTFAVWCEGPSSGFERALRSAGFRFTLERVGRGARTHHVYLAFATPGLGASEGEGAAPEGRQASPRTRGKAPPKGPPGRRSGATRRGPRPAKRRPT
jgi:predicted membrane-bound spermidine synthase